MPNINLDDAYILDETGAQVDKVTGLFTKDEDTTEEEKEFAQLNIGTAGSNRNLLDNPWFTVNQRGRSSYNSAGYSVDRWLSNGTQQVTVSSDGVTLGEQGYRFVQRMENPAIFAGKTLTISAKTNAANVRFAYWDSTSDYSNGAAITVPAVNGYASLTFNITNGIYAIGLSTASGTGGLYRAMKLELGSVSTLANDAPPDYGEELAKCQRYFVRFSPTAYTALWSGISANTSLAILSVITPVPMRAAPTVSVTNAFYFVEQKTDGPALRQGTAFQAYSPVANIVRLGVSTSSTLVTNSLVQAYTYAYAPVIDFSADL